MHTSRALCLFTCTQKVCVDIQVLFEFSQIATSQEWLVFHDQLLERVNSMQQFQLAAYLPYIPVKFHFLFASSSIPRVNYPYAHFEVMSYYTWLIYPHLLKLSLRNCNVTTALLCHGNTYFHGHCHVNFSVKTVGFIEHTGNLRKYQYSPGNFVRCRNGALWAHILSYTLCTGY